VLIDWARHHAAAQPVVTLDTIGAELERPVCVGFMRTPIGRAERR
jgi:hypothetical protein